MAHPNPLIRGILAAALCFIAWLPGAEPALGQRRRAESVGSPQASVTLGGWVRADYGQSIPSGVTVRLETDEGNIGGSQPANTSGYFEFVGLAKIYYRLTVTAPGFQPYQQEVDLRSVGDKLVINVQLSPAPKSASDVRPVSSSFTDNNASKKAHQEYEKGARAAREGNLSAAQSHFEKSVKEYPCYARAQTDLAVVLSERHQFTESEAALKQALKCDPDYLDPYNELGQLYYNEKRYQESEAVLREGLRRSPGSWQFYYQLGANAYRLSQYRDAEQEYLKAKSLSSSIPAEIHVKLADVYLRERALDKAYAEMHAYVLAKPSGPLAPKLKQVMRQMEADHVVTAAPSAAVRSLPPQR